MKPKYICIITTNGLGGVWSVVRESIPLLMSHYEVSIVIYSITGKLEKHVISFLQELNVKYLIIDIKYSNGWLFEFCKLLKYKTLKEFLPNSKAIIHSHDSFLSGALLYLLCSENYALFCTFHGAMIKESSLKSRIQFLLNKNIRLRFLYHSKAHLISCDPYSIPIIQTYFPTIVHIDVVVNGVKPYFSSIKRDEPSVFTIGYISRFHPLKGWNILADACEIIRKKGINIKLLFAGTGECESAIKEWCKEHDDYCIFRGQVDDIRRDVLPFINLHVLPTMYPEGLPMALLEAMSAGIPSITTNIGSCSYAIKNGVNGIIIKPNVEELVSGIILLLTNPALYKEMVKQSFEIWHKEFSSEFMVDRYCKIFRKYTINK